MDEPTALESFLTDVGTFFTNTTFPTFSPR